MSNKPVAKPRPPKTRILREGELPTPPGQKKEKAKGTLVKRALHFWSNRFSQNLKEISEAS